MDCQTFLMTGKACFSEAVCLFLVRAVCPWRCHTPCPIRRSCSLSEGVASEMLCFCAFFFHGVSSLALCFCTSFSLGGSFIQYLCIPFACAVVLGERGLEWPFFFFCFRCAAMPLLTCHVSVIVVTFPISVVVAAEVTWTHVSGRGRR